MKKYTKSQTCSLIEKTGFIPLFYSDNPQICEIIARSVFAGGGKVIEFTNRGPAAVEGIKSIIEQRDALSPEAIVGVGSINDPYTAAIFLSAGVNFVVGPGFNCEVAKLCNRSGILYVPGCASVTEILTASEYGVELVKIFPASSLGGPGFVKAVRGPLPWIKVVPTGGVKASKESLTEWLIPGVAAVGLGSDLINLDIVKEKGEGYLTELVREMNKTVKKIRKSS